ncbi:phosphopyruvate hydratase [Alphaproteobacteria bacterium]|nr:phosphopyruvate hydratase [Alphaproteobacteria bacterium]
MANIKIIKAREILDSRGNPTVECDIYLDDNSFGRSAIPSGASTGKHEAIELRDNDKGRYGGKGVKKAIYNILEIIAPKIINQPFSNFSDFDKKLISIDGTKNKSNLGANATLALSLAYAKALAFQKKEELFSYLSEDSNFILPVPMMNIVNGGSHADNSVDIQEFMIAPIGAPNFSESVRYGCEIFHSLKSKLKSKGLNTNVGDEGGFAPDIKTSNEVIELIIEAVNSVGLKMNKDITLSLDVASSEFYENSKYHLKGEKKILSSDEMIQYLKDLSSSYSIYSIEDGMSEDDWEGWQNLTKEIGSKMQLVGDDLFVTNIQRLQEGINRKIANSILIKINQIGTLTETLEAINLAKKNNYTNVISHRSGETEDTTIADLAVATSAGQIKTGSLTRTDRTSKYNQLLRIEEMLGNDAKFAGKQIIRH